jgi:protein-L-isoaspartate(D-aspartate) O-methyltransferase
MVEELKSSGLLGNPLIAQAFATVDRADFLPPEVLDRAYYNEPAAIGYGQTISQPWTVAFMLDLLEPGPGMKILDIGTGSGWQAALLGFVVSHGKDGKELSPDHSGLVIGLELIPELCAGAIDHIGKYSFIRKKVVEVHCLNAIHGYAAGGPYDRIIAAASGESIPPAWKSQLKIGGRLVAPVGQRIVLLVKAGDDKFTEKYFDNFSFVPFVNH